jgi:hypothetical protein
MIAGRMAAFLSPRRVAITIIYRIPAALYDIEMNAPGIPTGTRIVFGADAADCGTFCHGGTPLSVRNLALATERRDEERKTPQAGEGLRRRTCCISECAGGGGGRLNRRPAASGTDGPTVRGRLNPVPRIPEFCGRKNHAIPNQLPSSRLLSS